MHWAPSKKAITNIMVKEIRINPKGRYKILWRFKGRKGLFLKHIRLDFPSWLLHILFSVPGMIVFPFCMHISLSPFSSQTMSLSPCRGLPWSPNREDTPHYNSLSQLLVCCCFSSQHSIYDFCTYLLNYLIFMSPHVKYKLHEGRTMSICLVSHLIFDALNNA